MGIQVQKYSGNNIHNNCVYVDFVRKKVSFEPIEVYKIWTHLLYVFLQHLIMYSYMTMSLILLVSIILSKVGYFYPQSERAVIIMTMILLPPIIISLKYLLNKKWRDNEYPKYTAEINVLTMFRLFKKEEFKEVNLKNIRNNKLIIPSFKNIIFEYEATGDCATYLKEIKIENFFSMKDVIWCAVMIFSETPSTGKLKLRYI